MGGDQVLQVFGQLEAEIEERAHIDGNSSESGLAAEDESCAAVCMIGHGNSFWWYAVANPCDVEPNGPPARW